MFKRRIIPVLFILLIMVFGAIFLRSDFFTVKNIEIVGNTVFEYDDIVNLTGVEEGMSLFKLDTGIIKRNLQLSPYIKVKNISRRIPDTLRIEVDIGDVRAIVEDGDSYLLVDEDMLVLESRYDWEGAPCPLITGMDITSVKLGAVLSVSDEYQLNALKDIVNELYRQNAYSQVKVVNMSIPENIFLRSRNGIDIKLGQAKNIKDKVELLLASLIKLEELGKAYGTLDLSIDKRAGYRPTSPVIDDQSGDNSMPDDEAEQDTDVFSEQ